jgi:polyisoprenoid-binding protein YceI
MKNPTKWSIDAIHSEIGFSLSHLMISRVKGRFKKFDANIYTEGNNFSNAQIDLYIDVASIDTFDTTRDTHLRSPDFFDVAQHKQITFTASTLGKVNEEGNQDLWGQLTILGQSRTIKLIARFGGWARDSEGKERAGFSVTGEIDRTEWGLTWNPTLETGGFLVGTKVAIVCELELINEGHENLKMELESALNSN